MSAEQRKILDMLAEGKITAEEADRLFEALGAEIEQEEEGERERAEDVSVAAESGPSPRPNPRPNPQPSPNVEIRGDLDEMMEMKIHGVTP